MDFVNFEEAKQRLGKSDEELQGMIKRGDLRAFRDGGTWKFRKEDIDAKAGTAPAGAPAEGEKAAGDTLMSIDADILFAEEEGVPADSAAETWIAADAEGVFPAGAQAAPGPEQPRGVEEAMSAPETEPAPLALSPETDESSLGAVLSDEELGGTGSPMAAEEEPVIAIDAESGLASVVPGTTSGSALQASHTRVVTLVEPPAHHGVFTFMLGLAVLALGLAVFATISFLSNGVPGWLVAMSKEMTPLIIWVSVGVVVGIAAGVGFYLDKQRAARDALGNIYAASSQNGIARGVPRGEEPLQPRRETSCGWTQERS